VKTGDRFIADLLFFLLSLNENISCSINQISKHFIFHFNIKESFI